MNKNKKNFWLDIVLLALFVLIVVSLAGEGNPMWARVHYIAGILMILGSVIHLVWHWQWIKKNVLRFPRQINKVTRANRRIDIPLFILFLLCGVSGLAMWVMEIMDQGHFIVVLTEWADLHRMMGMLMSLIMVPHLGYHLKWLVCMARKSLSPMPRQSLKSSVGKSEF